MRAIASKAARYDRAAFRAPPMSYASIARQANATVSRSIAAWAGGSTCCQEARRVNLAVAAYHVEPVGLAEVGVRGPPVRRLEDAGRDVPGREVGDRVATGLEEQHRVVGRATTLPASSTLIFRRSGSAYSIRSGMGVVVMNAPLGVRPRSPCCMKGP
jgi:hypothetical protein